MGWLHRHVPIEETADGGIVGRLDGENDSPAHDSPALAEVFSSIDADHPVRVLDLGPASRVNLEFYSEFANGVRIAHLLRSDDLKRTSEPEDDSFVSLLDRLAPSGEETFGLILGWDILDHLHHEQPSILAHHLAAVADRGARLHVMTTTTDTMPAEPTRFEIDGPGRLVYRPTTERRITAPDPPPAQVERWLDPFRITRSVILRHGIREFLATLD
jgi:hypothetical protein